MSEPARPTVRFGPYRLEPGNARLSRGDTPVELPPKAFELLCFLALRPGRLVTKDELLDQVWGRRFITEAVIKTVVSELRAALGDDARAPRYVETVPRRGYRFVAELLHPPADAAADAGRPSAAADTGTPANPTATADTGPGALPLFITPPVGRAELLDQLATLLAAHALVTLVGPAGVGKTTVARAAALARRAAHAEGAWLVDLAPVPAGEAGAAVLRATLAQALRLNGAAAADEASLARALAPMQALVLLDNAEHVLDPLARLLTAVRAQAPRLQWLLTSQEPLQVAGEQVLRLAPLALPPQADEADPQRLMAFGALRLFVERIAARLPGFVLTPQQAGAAHQVCRLLDGLPLALELAAARVPLLGVHGLLERLASDDGSTLDALGRGGRDAPPRHRSLRDALAWSHALLTPREQAVFRRLAVFRGGFDAGLALQVAGEPGDDDVLDLLAALADKSLLVAQPLPGAQPLAAAPRLGLLEAPRALALEQLEAAGEAEPLRARHAQAVLRRLQQQVPLAPGMATFDWQDLVLPELPNLRAALAWARHANVPATLRLGLVAWGSPVLHAAGASAEAVREFDAAEPLLAGTPGLPPALRARWHHSLAQLAAGVTLPAVRGLAAAREAVRLWRMLGQAEDELWCLSFLLPLAHWVGDTQVDRAAALARMQALQAPTDALRGRPLRMTLGAELMRQGQWPGFRDAMQRELALLHTVGDGRGAWLAAANLCTAMLLLQQLDEAEALMRRTVQAVRAAGRARQLWQPMLMHSVCLLQLCAPRAGQRPARPARGARNAAAPQGPAHTRDEAEAAFEEAFALQQAAGARWQGLEHWSWLLALRGDLDNAARLHGWSDTMGQRLQMPRGPLSALAHRQMAERLLADLGPARLQALAAEGQAMADDEVLALLRRR